ncbi:Rne/Rng family ribonuclease [Glycomyces sp. TRM65418]|uniref:Rne/Rng family ribonuclease n=1 Tax=Glycomyces sp. TRM65418 TaxID=2867006 RepID=UPI001D168BF7|nr:Rne/Rng family ribonuclease [Glycomyces sp. TRM65418]MCC3763855.1 Rne/Rng family ribonuclease [Glycomyces sp. TRM65418]
MAPQKPKNDEPAAEPPRSERPRAAAATAAPMFAPPPKVQPKAAEPKAEPAKREPREEEPEPRRGQAKKTQAKKGQSQEQQPSRKRTRNRSESRSADRGGADKGAAEKSEKSAAEKPEPKAEAPEVDDFDDDFDDDDDSEAGRRRRGRRGRRGRGRGKGVDGAMDDEDDTDDEDDESESDEEDDEDNGSDGPEVTRRRRRRRRRAGSEDSDRSRPEESEDDAEVVVKVRSPQRRASSNEEVRGVSGSTRLEAKRQRRRDGRKSGRGRVQVVSEAEFLARREAVERQMIVRVRGGKSQAAVLEDGILAEHYVSKSGAQGLVGNVYLGKVQNVLPSMEAAFVDIGRGRNAVLYAGEVNWDATGLAGKARSIEQALKPGDPVLVQVTKDPVGHKGARLTSHIALSGRHLVYVPGGNASGISRKLPDRERTRLRAALKKLVPEGAGVIVRTAAEGAGPEELARDISRLQMEWAEIQAKAKKGNAPSVLHSEPDVLIRVVRDVFNEDFKEIVVEGDEAYDEIHKYLESVSPELLPRLKHHTGTKDVFAERRVDEQLLKALDRKVYLPSGGSLVIDRTEAMTVIDVNTGRFTGEGGNLEETVTRNNLEAAEEIVRQLRLRDIGGIIVIDFIDMVLESNRDLVLRRLTECLGRDRTKHQVTEVTSLGLVQMTRKRVGQGLIEAFSEPCDHCKGRGVLVHTDEILGNGRKKGNGNGNGGGGNANGGQNQNQSQQNQNGGGKKKRDKGKSGQQQQQQGQQKKQDKSDQHVKSAAAETAKIAAALDHDEHEDVEIVDETTSEPTSSTEPAEAAYVVETEPTEPAAATEDAIPADADEAPAEEAEEPEPRKSTQAPAEGEDDEPEAPEPRKSTQAPAEGEDPE